MIQQHPYFEKTALLTSKHKKLHLVASHFRDSCGLVVEEFYFDTDVLGTFSGEIERIDSPLQSAINKAHLGLKNSDYSIGIASEGSIAPDYLVPFVQSDVEIVVLVDRENDVVIHEIYRSFNITAVSKTISVSDELDDFLLTADFPHHHLIVMPNKSEGGPIFKGIDSVVRLKEAIKISASASLDNLILVQSDLRADRSPSRQKNISEAARLLSLKVASLCPHCSTPGWGRTDYIRGLNCSSCNDFIPSAVHREILGCVKCMETKSGKIIATDVDPANCPQCNP